MRIALFTDTFAPEVNGAAKTLYQFTQYVKSKQIPIQVFAPEFAHNRSFSTYVHRSPSMPFFLYPNSRFSLPNVLKLKAAAGIQPFSYSFGHSFYNGALRLLLRKKIRYSSCRLLSYQF